MGLFQKCHPNEGETSIDMRLAMKGLTKYSHEDSRILSK